MFYSNFTPIGRIPTLVGVLSPSECGEVICKKILLKRKNTHRQGRQNVRVALKSNPHKPISLKEVKNGMAHTEQEYRNAIARVSSGNGSSSDFSLTREMARVAGNFGESARDALKKSGK